MKKILIALDYSPTAQRVAEAGHALAKDMNATIVLLHVVSNPAYYSSTEYSPVMGFTGYMDIGVFQSGITNDLEAVSNDFLESTKKHLNDDSIEIMVKDGGVAESILEAAKDSAADMIVMGTHSRKWLEQVLLGSETETVIRQSSIPVFVIPTKG